MIDEMILYLSGGEEKHDTLCYFIVYLDEPTPPDMSVRSRVLRIMKSTYDRTGRLPAMRQLSHALTVPFNQVRKAYTELQAQGLIELVDVPGPKKTVSINKIWILLDYDGLFNPRT